MSEPPLPRLHLFEEAPDRDAALHLIFAVRDVYRRCKSGDATAPPVLTTEGIAELRGSVGALRRLGHLSEASALEILTPVLGEPLVREWFRRSNRIVDG